MAEFDGRAFLGSAVGFGRALRGEGLSGDLSSAIDFANSLTAIDIGSRAQVRAAGAACFVRRRDELPTYNRVFNRWWRAGNVGSEATGIDPPAPAGQGLAGEPSDDLGADGGEPGDGELLRRVGWSPADITRLRAFAQMTPAELAEAERLVDSLAPRLATRRTRRHEPHAHGRRLDPRVMLRRSLATGGEPLAWAWQRPTRRPRPIVALIDVSGSMERYARLLLRFVHALSRTPARTEAFVFGSHLHRVTRLLHEHSTDAALERIGREASYGAGGTRIGQSLRTFNRTWARRVLPGSGVVLVLSDGWDHGRPELIAAETARLARLCHELVWLNPLAGAEGYEPVATGMAAALPHVDRFLPVSRLADLEALGNLLAAPAATDHAS